MTVADAALLAVFESDNSAFFEKFVPARPSDYFEAASLKAIIKVLLQSDQDRFYLICDHTQKILGRANIVDIETRMPKTAEIGFRVAEQYCGKGIGGWAVRQLTEIAKDLGLETVTALASTENPSSCKALLKGGFSITNAPKVSAFLNGSEIMLTTFQQNL